MLRWVGFLAIAIGLATLLLRPVERWLAPEWEATSLGVVAPQKSPDTGASPPFPATRVEGFNVRHAGGQTMLLHVAHYRDAAGARRRAILYPPSETAHPLGDLRHAAWSEFSAALRARAEPSAIVLAWWDNGQRIDYLTGQSVWVAQPPDRGFGSYSERDLWESLAGPLEAGATRNRELAEWLSMDVERALDAIDARFPPSRPVYLVACMDDLARLNEIETLAERRLAVDARRFASTDNLHNTISAVKRWADESQPRSYLVQSTPRGEVIAWRIADLATANTLLARLQPFTHSLEHPSPRLELVFRSTQGLYLSAFRLLRTPPPTTGASETPPLP